MHHPVKSIKPRVRAEAGGRWLWWGSCLFAESPKRPSVLTHPSLLSLLGTQISCFPPINVSMRQAVYVDSFCWAAVQQQDGDLPLWLHKVPTLTQHALLTAVTAAVN